MKIHDLNGKKVCILGYGREGAAMLQALRQYAPDADMMIGDRAEKLEIPAGIQSILGDNWLDALNNCDIIIKSPGIPPRELRDPADPRLTNSMQIFFDTVKESGALTIGVTGSKGKSTTASLIHHILKTAGKNGILIGNIGEPAIAHLDDADQETIFVCELSSYQLLNMTTSPHIAVLTSFFPEHLDYHGNLEAYKDAKSHIAEFQAEEDIVVFNADDAGCREIADLSSGTQLPVSAEDAPIALEKTHLIGRHNLGNIALAVRAAQQLGIKESIINEAISSFQPLPHRLQDLGIHHGIRWIDDAISTTPESTLAALEALDHVDILILGGQDRGYDFKELAETVAESPISHIILFPGSGPRIKAALIAAKAPQTIQEVSSMQEAVQYAKDHLSSKTNNEKRTTKNDSVILLSTASPSYGMFKNFEEKGDEFQRCVSTLS